MEEETTSSSHRTFRDPAGSLEVRPDGALRLVREPYTADILAFLQSPLASKLVADKALVSSDVLHSDGDGLW